MVIYGAEDLLGSYYEAHHLPDGGLKVHLRELEQALEEARHLDALAAIAGHGASEVGRGPAMARQRYLRVHGGERVNGAGGGLRRRWADSVRGRAWR